jgi:hypothetical protein
MEKLMQGIAINQIDNIVTFQIDDDYQFDDQEPVKIESQKMTYFDELLKLYWVLLDWIVDSGSLWGLPEDDIRYFSRNNPKTLLKEKLYYLIRWRTGFVKNGWNPNGMPAVEVKSVSKRETKQNELSKHCNDAIEYFASYIDMTEFNRMHQATRERLGKFY